MFSFSNEIVFIIQTGIIATAVLVALKLGAHALVALICAYCLLANVFVLKQTTLLGLTATCSDAFTIGATLGLNILQEYYGKSVTKMAIATNFFILVLYAMLSQIQLWYEPSVHDTMHQHYVPLLHVMPRIVIASFSVYLIAQIVDYAVYGFLKKHWQRRFLILRNYCSTATSQLVDTVLFSFLGLYGLVDNIGHIILISYTVKMIAILIATPFVGLSRFVAPKNQA